MKKLVCEDFVNSDRAAKKGYGKNFESLVANGEWEICGFKYGRSRCGCCGRPISRILMLKNRSHEAAVQRDPLYSFQEVVDIGVVCGPRVFAESCASYYSDPGKEWLRQFNVWKHWINFVMLYVQNKDIWESIPEDVTKKIDEYLEEGWKCADTTADWWRLRDAKARVLKTYRDGNKVPKSYYLKYNIQCLINVAVRLGIMTPSTAVVEQNASNYKVLVNGTA